MFRKKYVFGLMVVFFLASSVYSQEGPPRQKPPSKEEHLKHLTERLELTNDQIKQIENILETSKEKMDKLREKAEEDRKQHFDKMKVIHDEEDKKIEKLLTNEQKQKFVQLKKEKEKKRSPRGRKRQD